MIQLKSLTIHTRYTPGTFVYFIDGDGGRLTLRSGTIFRVDVRFYDGDWEPYVPTVAIHEHNLARSFYDDVDITQVYLDAGAAARALAKYNSETHS